MLNMLNNDLRIARVQKSLRWFEEDVPLLNMRVKELSVERQESARRFATAVIDQTRAELERLLQVKKVDRASVHEPPLNDGHDLSHSVRELFCEPAD